MKREEIKLNDAKSVRKQDILSSSVGLVSRWNFYRETFHRNGTDK